jgi:hypothetical protein
MKLKVYAEALKMLAKCHELRLYNLSLRDILDTMHQTAIFEQRHIKASIIMELINENTNQ